MRCAIYIRVSTDKKEQETSLGNQKDLFFNYVSDQGWDIYKFYVDVESGTTDKREKLQEMIQDAKQRKFDIILAKELSRLARNGKLSYEIKDIALINKIHIITLDGAINTITGRDDMFGLYAWMYEEESKRTSKRIKYALITKARKGEFKGSIPPYGYELKKGKLFIRIDDTPNVVKRIFRMYLEGIGFDAIARTLTREGYPTPAQIAGKKNAGQYWHGSSIKCILSNPHYVGDLVQNRETTASVTTNIRNLIPKDEQIVYENAHSPIISREDFDAVQNYMQSRRRQEKKPKAKIHLFTNIAYCHDCGKSLWFVQSRKGYVCGNYYKHGKTACTSHSIKEKTLIEILLNDFKHVADTVQKKDLMNRLESKFAKSKNQVTKQIQTIDTQIKNLKNENNKAMKHYMNEKFSEQEYRDFVEANREIIENLMNKKYHLNATIENSDNANEIIHLKNELERFLKFEEMTVEILHRLVSRIEVHNDGTVEIQYRFNIVPALVS